MTMFRNFYDCPCGYHWTDDWSATCDDRCPMCDTSCSPTNSEELDEKISSIVMFDFFKIERRLAEQNQGMVYDPLSMLDDMELLEYGTFEFPKTNVPDWKRTKFVSGDATLPDASTRAKLRAKRKKK